MLKIVKSALKFFLTAVGQVIPKYWKPQYVFTMAEYDKAFNSIGKIEQVAQDNNRT